MRFLIQRVKKASVEVENCILGQIDHGYLVLIGISENDTKETADQMIKKMLNLRIFEDSDGKTNLSIHDVNGKLLLVSQFTLYADCRKGNRPSFIHAGDPEHANNLYEYIISECTRIFPDHIEIGQFGADMQISLVNDGPFTVMLDSEYLFNK